MGFAALYPSYAVPLATSREMPREQTMQGLNDPLERLERWYAAQCNGDWEHTYGLSIETVDNPGWSFKVELTDTYLSDRTFEEVHENHGNDQREFLCRVKDRVFIGQSPPNRLRDVISIFLRWAEGPPVG
jgi:hypothetical protein